jgi:hypothetical protein
MIGKKNNTLFAIPKIWHNPSSHLQTAVLFNIYQEHSNNSKDKIRYPSISSAIKAMSRGETLQVPETPSN